MVRPLKEPHCWKKTQKVARYIDRNPGSTIGQIEVALKLGYYTAFEQINKLYQAGFIQFETKNLEVPTRSWTITDKGRWWAYELKKSL
ncbi:MarR family transcriptional regulator [Streptomyces sp. CoH17]|uniref:MarR family transcriptional regulator n=1 Tax=Streptomyces sp. CoH17 TaxID=2992806 RepID=UPI00226EB31D|nr:helix-turn-helix domain-containing protein [Streptomyces sp. CoH17]